MGEKMKKGRGGAVADGRSRGSTIVEVIASFGILVMLTAIFADVFMTGSRTADRMASFIEERDALYEAYHLGEGLQAERAGGGTVHFKRIDGDGLEEGFVLRGMGVYAHTSTEDVPGVVYDVRPEGER